MEPLCLCHRTHQAHNAVNPICPGGREEKEELEKDDCSLWIHKSLEGRDLAL